MATILQRDPSRTITLRKQFSADMARRFARMREQVWGAVVQLDVFGLSNSNQLVLHTLSPRAFEFRTDPEKIQAFRDWMEEEIAAGILKTDNKDPWLSKYVTGAYNKGRKRGYSQVFKTGVEMPLGVALAGPVEMARVEAIMTRAWTDLRGITDVMGQKISRILATGFIQGANPLELARQMVKEISSLSRNRAELIARTEIIAAHAEGQLDAYEALKVNKVEVLAEWLTAGDDRVCDECSVHSGDVMTVEEARGLIPMHPLCRCAWAPVTRTE